MVERREKKIEGLMMLRSLAQYHMDTLQTRLHDVCLALVQEVAPPLWACSMVLSLALSRSLSHSLSLPLNLEPSICHCGWAWKWAGGQSVWAVSSPSLQVQKQTQSSLQPSLYTMLCLKPSQTILHPRTRGWFDINKVCQKSALKGV